MNYDNIRTALDGALQSTPGLPKVQHENTRITENGRTPWCRTTLLPAEAYALNTGLNGTTQHQGLYQVDLFYPQDSATSALNELSAAVQAALPRGLQIVHDERTTTEVLMSWQQTSYRVKDTTWYVVPVLVRWVTYAS